MGDPKFNYDGFEPLRDFSDAFSNPEVRIITVIKSGQTGYTTEMLNILGYTIDEAPGPTLVVYPTETNAIRFSKRKLSPMLRDTPRLHGKVSDVKKKDGANSTLEKTFPGGFISIVGGASVNSLSAQSIMYLIIDEKDRIPKSSGNEGSTDDILSKRLQGFLEVYKKINISTPTIKNFSAIENDYLSSNQMQCYVPCPECGYYQTLKFEQLKGWRIAKGVYDLSKTYYECENPDCKVHLYERDKYWMLKKKEWRADKPERTNHYGFKINELYSTLSTWEYIVDQFIKCKDNPAKLQTFYNLVLGETFEDLESSIDDNVLIGRREEYTSSKLPEGIIVLTAGIDIQGDRAEVVVKGWGLGEENWFIEFKTFYGSPQVVYSKNPENLYYQIETYLDKTFTHSSGIRLRISAVGIDTGFATRYVQRWVKKVRKNGKLWIFALQGDKGKSGAPVLNRPTTNNKLGIKQFTVGTATCKTIIFARLAIDEYGPGYMHFNMDCNEEFFKQLAGSEKALPLYKNGQPVGKKYVQVRARNEKLDCEVYNYAALDYLNTDLEAINEDFQMKVEKLKEANKESNEDEAKEVVKKNIAIQRPKNNYVTNW